MNHRKSKTKRTGKRETKRLGLTWRFRRAWLRAKIRKADLRNQTNSENGA